MSILKQGQTIDRSELIQEQSPFSNKEHDVWKHVLTKQILNLQDKAYPTFLSHFERMNLSAESIPDLQVFNKSFFQKTGWKVVPVDGILEHQDYFELLKNCRFPVAMIMRSSGNAQLIKDPDIFHEVFGHCTMLMDERYANFMREFAKFALTVDVIDRDIVARLLWFTTETGLIKTEGELKIFGSSILSSYKESQYCLASSEPTHKPFNLVEIFREPYRADILQSTYFVMDDVEQLYTVLDDVNVIFNAIKTARKLGEHPARFPVTSNKYSNIGHCKPIEKG